MNKYITLTRDSVCAGDDVDAPHEMTLDINDCKNINDIMVKIKNKYLPKISGGKATWIVRSCASIAVIAQEWELPKTLLGSDELAWGNGFPDSALSHA